MKKLRQVGATVLAMLREIFDEAAYRRFLQQSGKPQSRASYREFSRQKLNVKPRPRCC